MNEERTNMMKKASQVKKGGFLVEEKETRKPRKPLAQLKKIF